MVLRNGEVANQPIECHILMRLTQWYRFPRHLEVMQFWGMCAVLACALLTGAANFQR